MTSVKPAAGQPLPSVALPLAGGGGITLGGGTRWQMIVVYRGRHCPICQRYLKRLDGLLEEFGAIGVDVVAVSADTKEKAEGQVAEEGWRFPVGYDLDVDQMRRLGLYVSQPRSPQETDRPFPEPALFVVTPDGRAQVIDISNAPFARPELGGVLAGLKLIQEKNYPIRGTLA